MSVIIAGRLAAAILRMGFVTDDVLDGDACDAIRLTSRVSKRRTREIWESLESGAAGREFLFHGIKMGDDALGHDRRVAAKPDHVPLRFVVGGKTNGKVLQPTTVCHYSGPLMRGSICVIDPSLGFGSDAYVTGGPLLYLLESRQLGMAGAVAMGMELCGSYLSMDGNAWQTTYDVPVATSLEELSLGLAAIDRACGQLGAQHPMGLTASRRALRYVVEGAASPVETMLGVTFNLPSICGGRGFGPIAFNGRLELEDHLQEIAGKPYLLLDLVLHGKARKGYEDNRSTRSSELSGCVALEYDSREFHENVAATRDPYDRRRMAAAELAGVQLIPLTWEVLRDEERFDYFCEQVALALGKRQRPPSTVVLARRHEARRELGLPLGSFGHMNETTPLYVYEDVG